MSMWYLDLPKGEQYFNWNELFYHVLLGEQDRKRQEYRIDSPALFGLVQLRSVSGIQHLITFGNFSPRIQFRLICDGFSGIYLRLAKPSYYAESVQQYPSQGALQYISHSYLTRFSSSCNEKKIRFVLFNGLWSRIILEFSVGSLNQEQFRRLQFGHVRHENLISIILFHNLIFTGHIGKIICPEQAIYHEVALRFACS